MTEEFIDIVDDEDTVVGKAPRKEVIDKALIHRASHVIVIDYFRRFLVQKRSAKKGMFPGLWDLGASETVVSGESYELAAVRGLKEELGIDVTKNELTFLFTARYRSGEYNANIGVYSLMYNGRLEMNTDEVDELRHMSAEEIKELIKENVFAPNGALVFERHIKERGGIK